MTGPSCDPDGRGFWARLHRTDRLIFAYCAVTAALVAAFAPRIPSWPLLLAGNLGALAALAFGVARIGPGSPVGWRAVRALYPVFFVWAAYAQTGAMNQIVHPGFHDARLRAWDLALFGGEPAHAFAAALPHRAVAEAMHGVYFAYYLLFPGLALRLFLRREAAALEHYFATLCGAFAACCLAFVLFPAAGPAALKPPAPPGSVFPWIMELIYRWFEKPGGAFPSSHVVVALITLAFAWRHAGRWRPAFVVGCLGVVPATVYCTYHYLVDVLAGIAVAAVALALARRARPGLRPG